MHSTCEHPWFYHFRASPKPSGSSWLSLVAPFVYPEATTIWGHRRTTKQSDSLDHQGNSISAVVSKSPQKQFSWKFQNANGWTAQWVLLAEKVFSDFKVATQNFISGSPGVRWKFMLNVLKFIFEADGEPGFDWRLIFSYFFQFYFSNPGKSGMPGLDGDDIEMDAQVRLLGLF